MKQFSKHYLEENSISLILLLQILNKKLQNQGKKECKLTYFKHNKQSNKALD